MYNIVQFGSAVDMLVQYQGPKACLTWMYTHNTRRVFVVFQMCRVPVSDLITYYNACSNPEVHVVLREDHKMVMKGTGLYHRIFLHIFVSHHHLIEHDTLVMSTSVYFPIFCFFLDRSLHFNVIHWTDVFEILVLN